MRCNPAGRRDNGGQQGDNETGGEDAGEMQQQWLAAAAAG